MNRFSRGNDGQLLRDQLEATVQRADEAEAHAERLRVALDAVPVGMIVVAPDGVVVLRNRAAVMPGHAEIIVKDVVDRLCSIARRGQRAEERVSLFGPPARVLLVRAIPLSDGGALGMIDDLSERARLDAVRTDFVSNISHELKTPVGALALLNGATATTWK